MAVVVDFTPETTVAFMTFPLVIAFAPGDARFAFNTANGLADAVVTAVVCNLSALVTGHGDAHLHNGNQLISNLPILPLIMRGRFISSAIQLTGISPVSKG